MVVFCENCADEFEFDRVLSFQCSLPLSNPEWVAIVDASTLTHSVTFWRRRRTGCAASPGAQAPHAWRPPQRSHAVAGLPSNGGADRGVRSERAKHNQQDPVDTEDRCQKGRSSAPQRTAFTEVSSNRELELTET